MFCQLYGGSQNFEIGSSDPGHAHLGVILRFIHRKDPCPIIVPNLKQIGQVVKLFKSHKGDPKISKLGHVTQATPT